MKTKTLFSKIMLLLLAFVLAFSVQAEEQKDSDDLKNLVISWADGFSEYQPQSKLMLQSPESNDFGLAESALLITDEAHMANIAPHHWRMPIARNVVVGVVHKNHPKFSSWNETGLTSEALAGYLQNNLVLIPENNQLISMLEKFTGTTADTWKTEKLTDDEDVLQALSQKTSKIGFVRYDAIKNESNTNSINQLSLLPIDRNMNGKLDPMENFYSESNRFERAVWMGKYPHVLTNTYFLTAANTPSGDQISFINWALNQGQQMLVSGNIGQLPLFERNARLDNLNNIPVTPPATIIRQPTWQKLILPAFGLLLVIGLVISSQVLSGRNAKKQIDTSVAHQKAASRETPQGLLFDHTHTWTLMQKDGWVKTGVDDFILNATGPLSRVKLKKAGEQLIKGEVLAHLIQNGKNITIFSPVTGTVKAVNETIHTNIDELNQSPYDRGWLYQIEPSNWQQENKLMMMAHEYTKWISFEMNRMRDFFTTIATGSSSQHVQTVLQDGGEPSAEVLKNCGPEVWENFQTSFINPSR